MKRLIYRGLRSLPSGPGEIWGRLALALFDGLRPAAQIRGLLYLLALVFAFNGWRAYETSLAPDAAAALGPPATSGTVAPLQRAELNTAEAWRLEEIRGIGPTLAKRIIEYRDANGGFASADELRYVKGMYYRLDTLLPYFYADPAKRPAPKSAPPALPERRKTNLNNATHEQIAEEAGLPKGLAQRMVNFREACLGFSDFAHVAQTRGLTETQLQALKNRFFVQPDPARQININAATAEELDRLPLIGKKRSRTIVNFRKVLGFYFEKEQLREVYNLPDSVYAVIEPLVKVGDVSAKLRISLGKADPAALGKHPYLRKHKRAILRLRKNGPPQSLEAWRTGLGLSEEAWRKVKPYVTV